MTENRALPWRKIVWVLSFWLIALNVVIAIWHGIAERRFQLLERDNRDRVTQSGKLQLKVKQLTAEVDERYDEEVRDYRRLGAITSLARDREDLPITSGDDIASWIIRNADGDKNKIRALVYIPQGDHRLCYSYQEFWGEKELKYFDYGVRHGTAHGPIQEAEWDRNTVTLDLPKGEVHELDFVVEQVDEQTRLRVTVAGHDERTFPLRPCEVGRQRTEQLFHMQPPNQHLGPADEANGSGSLWRRSETVQNELLYHGMRLEIRKPVDSGAQRGPTKGGLRLRCWIRSDDPVSASALTVAAHSPKFLRRYMKDGKHTHNGPVPDVDELFRPYDDSGVLYYKEPPMVE